MDDVEKLPLSYQLLMNKYLNTSDDTVKEEYFRRLLLLFYQAKVRNENISTISKR